MLYKIISDIDRVAWLGFIGSFTYIHYIDVYGVMLNILWGDL